MVLLEPGKESQDWRVGCLDHIGHELDLLGQHGGGPGGSHDLGLKKAVHGSRTRLDDAFDTGHHQNRSPSAGG